MSSGRNKTLAGKVVIVFFLLSFLAFSVAAFLPDTIVEHDEGPVSGELKTQEVVEGSATTNSYMYGDGSVTFAVDKGYAIVYKLKNADGKVVEEYYYDENHSPILKNGDYHGITYEYSDGSVWITYVDENRMPLMCKSGYAYIMRTLDDKGRNIDDYYFDLKMKPVCCTSGYYGLHREYDEKGQNSSILYLNESGQPMNGAGGYALKTYLRDEKGTVVEERYFDAQGMPLKSTLGQCGELYVNDDKGRRIQTIYLGADGNPAPVYAGYASIKRTYYKDGTVDTEMYFDEQDNPIALSKGQFGIKHSGKVNLLLDENGKVMFCLENILNGYAYLVVIIGCLLCALILLLPKKYSILLTGLYVLFIFYETMMFRVKGGTSTNFQLFSYAGIFWKNQFTRTHVVQNFWLFVPFGTGLYRIFRKNWVFVVPFLFSLAIEFTQYATHLGTADINDIFGNTVGGILGILAGRVFIPVGSETSGMKNARKGILSRKNI